MSSDKGSPREPVNDTAADSNYGPDGEPRATIEDTTGQMIDPGAGRRGPGADKTGARSDVEDMMDPELVKKERDRIRKNF